MLFKEIKILKTMKNGLIIFSALCLIFFASCSKISKKDIKVEKAKWEALNATKYEFDYNASCFCAGLDYFPAKLVVENNVITGFLDIDTGLPKTHPSGTLVSDSLPSLSKTIDDLFDVVEDARKDAAELNVTFDNDNGFPTDIDIDWIRNAVDDESYYTATNFKQL